MENFDHKKEVFREMKKNILLAATSLLLICFFIPVLGTPQEFPSISSYGTIKYPSFKIGIYTSSWNFAEYDAATIAETFDMSQSFLTSPENMYEAKMNQVHALNPNYKALVYRNVMSIYNYETDEWNLANSKGWLLKDVNGNYVTEPQWPENYYVDITNPEYQLWLGATVKSWLDQYPFFDGVMADNSLKYSVGEWLGSDRVNSVINPSTGVPFTTEQVLDGCAGLLNAIIDAIGPSKLLLPNGIWSGFVFADPTAGANYRYILSKVPRLNGLMSEGTFMASTVWLSEAQWKQSVDMVVWIQDNILAGHPERCFATSCYRSVPAGATEDQVIKYGVCSMLLAANYSSPQNVIYLGYGSDHIPSAAILQLLQTLRNADFLDPLGNYYQINGTSVYTRDFTGGTVLVNPSDSSYTLSLSKSYTTLEGQTVNSITIGNHTGILLRALE